MKTLLLAIWLVWQSITAPFYPDPAKEVAEASSYLKAELVVGTQLTPELMRKLRSAGFQFRPLDAAVEEVFRREKPWSELPKSRLYGCSKSIQGRPAISVTDVHAWFALGADDVILLTSIQVLQTNL